MTEEEIKTNHQAEIINLRMTNSQLHQALAESAAEKMRILASINDLLTSKSQKKGENQQYQNIYQHIVKSLEEIKWKYQ